MRDRAAVAAAMLLGLFAAARAATANDFPDLFIYRAGSVLALRGESPYDLARVRELVAAQFPDPGLSSTSFVNNCGYFLPPAAVLLFAPLAVVPWPTAKLLWAVATAVAGWAVARTPDLFRRPGEDPPRLTALLPFVLLLNPLVAAVVVVGQTSLVLTGCVALGLRRFERGRPTLGTLLWVMSFVKPHLALPLVPLAWYLGGWKRAAGLVAVVAGLNVAGAVMVGGSPIGVVRDYFDFLTSAHAAVLYNRAELNPQITSWNRLLYAAGGPLVELTAATTLAGYAVWAGLVLVRVRVGGRPSAAWATAAAAVGGLVCCQVLGYELVWLALVTPWVRDLFADGWRVRGWLAVGLMAGQLLPAEVVGPARPFGVALLAVLVLAGPITRRS